MNFLSFRLSVPIFITLLSSNAYSETEANVFLGSGPKQKIIGVSGFNTREVAIGEDFIAFFGVGLRASHFQGKDLFYQTGGTKDRLKVIEKIKIDHAKHTALNAGSGVEIGYTPFKLSAGFSIDLFGYSWGSSSSYNGTGFNGSGVSALRNGYNDYGSLYSEMYLKKSFDAVGVKIGTTHSVTQLRADSDISAGGTRRFLNFSDTFMVGVIFRM